MVDASRRARRMSRHPTGIETRHFPVSADTDAQALKGNFEQIFEMGEGNLTLMGKRP
jgi:hypothetical protein